MKLWLHREAYIVNLPRFAHADGYKGFGPESLHGEGDAACYVTNSSERFEDSHFFCKLELRFDETCQLRVLDICWLGFKGLGFSGVNRRMMHDEMHSPRFQWAGLGL